MAATAGVVDLTDVKEGGNFRPRRKPKGDYRAKIVKADDHQPNDKNKPKGWVLTIQVEGDARSTYPYYLNPEKKQAWKIATICRAAGLRVPNGRIRFDPNKLVNKAIGVYLDDDEYEGREKSVVDDVFPVSEVGANADDEPEIEDEIVDEDEVVEDDEPEDEEEPEPTPPPRKRTTTRKRKPEPEPEPEEDEEEDEEEEDDTPPPTRRRKAATPPAKRVAKKPAPPADEDDDLDDLDLDDLEG